MNLLGGIRRARASPAGKQQASHDHGVKVFHRKTSFGR
jgi:hypothetical protein